MDPRGIVDAATASQFTGVIYGLTAKPIAGLLNVAKHSPTGVGLVGDDAWLVPFGRCLAEAGVETLLVTTELTTVDQPAPDERRAVPATTSLREGINHVRQAVGGVRRPV